MIRVLCAAVPALCLSFAAVPAAAAPARDGAALAFAITQAGPAAADVSFSHSCARRDTATVRILFAQTVDGPGDPAAWGRAEKKVVCTGRITQDVLRVPVRQHAPLLPGRTAIIQTTLYNSAGRQIHDVSAVRRVQEPPAPAPAAAPAPHGRPGLLGLLPGLGGR